MVEFRLVKINGAKLSIGAKISIYTAEESKKALRKMLEEAWEDGSRRKGQWVREGIRCINLKSARYRDVTKILEKAKKKEKE